MAKFDWKSYDYQSEVLIDEYKLDMEWKKQPALAVKYGEAKADAQRDQDIAKEKLDYLIAQKDTYYRGTAEGKTTESAIKSKIDQDDDVVDARQRLIKCKHTVALMQAACDGFNQRKSALENLVKLFGMNYFVEPAADIESRGTVEAIQVDAAKKKVKEAMGHRRTK